MLCCSLFFFFSYSDLLFNSCSLLCTHHLVQQQLNPSSVFRGSELLISNFLRWLLNLKQHKSEKNKSSRGGGGSGHDDVIFCSGGGGWVVMTDDDAGGRAMEIFGWRHLWTTPSTNKSNRDNYWAIAVISIIGKVFSTILLERLHKFKKEKFPDPPNQLGFTKGAQTYNANNRI